MNKAQPNNATPGVSNIIPNWLSDAQFFYGMKIIGLIGLIFFPVVLVIVMFRHKCNFIDALKKTWSGWWIFHFVVPNKKNYKEGPGR
jgi:hypothetical protein